MEKLNQGDKIPYFEVKNQDGEVVTSDSFAGKHVILYFYPKDNTPGCMLEAQNMRDGKQALVDAGFEIFGISPDSEESHRNFCKKHDLNFTLLSDPDKKAAEAFGVWGEKKMYGRTVMGIKRTTFIIAPDGTIEKIFAKVDTKNHYQQILEWYNASAK